MVIRDKILVRFVRQLQTRQIRSATGENLEEGERSAMNIRLGTV